MKKVKVSVSEYWEFYIDLSENEDPHDHVDKLYEEGEVPYESENWKGFDVEVID